MDGNTPVNVSIVPLLFLYYFSIVSLLLALFPCPRHAGAMKSEIILEVTEAKEGGYCASIAGLRHHHSRRDSSAMPREGGLQQWL